jgi:hypothetical protein
MAGTIIVSSIKTDTDNSFIVRSNTGATLFSVDTTSISIPDGSITSAMIANGTVIAADILDGTITDAKIAAVANTKITGLITSGQIATVANTQITGNITQAQIATGVAGTGPAFSAYANAATSLTNGAFTKISFQVEDYDTNNNFASSRFTPTVAGYYQISAASNVSGGTTAELSIAVYKNGAGHRQGSDFITAGAQYSQTISTLVYLNGSSDFVEIYVYIDAAAKSTGTGGNNVWFNGAMIRSA